MNRSLYGYQQKLVDLFVKSRQGHRRIVVVSPTGSGKTTIALYGLVPLLKPPVAWITHRVELLKQVDDHRLGVDAQMVQSFKPRQKYQSIIIDEAHHVCAKTYRDLMNLYPDACFVALTATPYRMDGVGLGTCGFTDIVYGPDTLELTKLDFLCPAKVYVPKSETVSAWTAESVCDEILRRRFVQGIAYCRTVTESNALSKAIQMRGISSCAVDAKTSDQSRSLVSSQFTNQQVQLICNHTIYTEGYDVPSVDLIVMNRPTASRCLWKQMLGRGLRKAHKKESCTVLDFAGNGLVHGSIYDQEIFDLSGEIVATHHRESPIAPMERTDYRYNPGEELKEWTPPPKPIAIIESLQRLRSKSPLRRLLTA